MRRIGFLWLPHWPTDRLRRDTPDDPSPLVVSRNEGRHPVIAAACPRATRLGLHAGMKLAQAQAMLPGLRVVRETPQSAQADRDALTRLAAWCLRATPLTCALPPDGIWLDITGCAHLHGGGAALKPHAGGAPLTPDGGGAVGETALLSGLAAHLRRAGLCARIALADTPGAAHALAHHGQTELTIAPPGGQQALLALPVAALRLDEAAVTLLHRFGLRHIADLAALPRAPLAKRLGATVALRLDQALGRIEEPIMPMPQEAPVSEQIGFVEPLLTAEALAAAIGVLAGRLCRRLEACCLGAKRLELLLHRIDSSRQSQQVALARPSHASRHIARLFEERLDQVDPGEGIETMRLTAILSEPLQPGQDLFPIQGVAPSHALGDHALADLAPLIDRLSNRLGAGQIWRPAPVQSDVPERSVRALPPLAPSKLDWLAAWPARLPRPIRLFDPPMPVRTLTVLPDQPPSFFVWRNHRHRVRRADGPERIAGEWWQHSGELLSVRDYFRLEDETGRRFWLFRRGDGEDAVTGDLRWFLHGML